MKILLRHLVSMLALIIILAFIGVEPLASYKDKIIGGDKVVEAIDNTNSPAEVGEYGGYAEKLDKAEFDRRAVIEIEQEVVGFVNAIRVDRGSIALVWDETLYSYSKAHSEDMANQRRLFHSPEGMPYAENAWGGEGSTSWDADDIVVSWMDSPFHRTWLLCPNLRHIAVGIAKSDTGMYASWTFWVGETDYYSDWWYCNGLNIPPDWWY